MSAQTRTGKLEAFQKILENPSYLRNLRAAEEDPTGPEAAAVLKKVLPFVNLSLRIVPFSMDERASEVTGLIAAILTSGAASMFVTCAIDDVHNPKAALLTMPFKTYDHAAQEEIHRKTAASGIVARRSHTRRTPHG